MLDFLKILNMGFCCTIIGKFHAKNQNNPPHRFRAAQPVTDGRGESDNHNPPKFSIEKFAGGQKLIFF